MSRIFASALVAGTLILIGLGLSLAQGETNADKDALVGPPALLPSGDPDSSEFIGPRVRQPFQILASQVAPGERARLEWNARIGLAGSEPGTPVQVLQGVRPGPVLCLAAGVHGDELNSIEIVRRLADTVEPDDLGGTIVAVPLVNLSGYLRNSRYLPDRRDLNRFFPGSRHGSIASRMAYSLFSEVIVHCDALVDLHTGSFDRRNLPQVRADLSRPDVGELARGCAARRWLARHAANGRHRDGHTGGNLRSGWSGRAGAGGNRTWCTSLVHLAAQTGHDPSPAQLG